MNDNAKKKLIRSITVTAKAVAYNHMLNMGEKQLGNLSGIKRRPDGRVYVSGQKQKHAFFQALSRLNDKEGVIVTNGDGPSGDPKTDLRSDLGGFMLPKKKEVGKSRKRRAPVSATMATAVHDSQVGLDLLLRLLRDDTADTDRQALASREFSQEDEMEFSFNIQTELVGVTVEPVYTENVHTSNRIVEHIDKPERIRRIKLALESTRFLVDYANQARNMASLEPQEVYIVLDTVMSRGAATLFAKGNTEQERKNLIKAVTSRGGKVVHGDNRTEKSVEDAYQEALAEIKEENVYLIG